MRVKEKTLKIEDKGPFIKGITVNRPVYRILYKSYSYLHIYFFAIFHNSTCLSQSFQVMEPNFSMAEKRENKIKKSTNFVQVYFSISKNITSLVITTRKRNIIGERERKYLNTCTVSSYSYAYAFLFLENGTFVPRMRAGHTKRIEL